MLDVVLFEKAQNTLGEISIYMTMNKIYQFSTQNLIVKLPNFLVYAKLDS